MSLSPKETLDTLLGYLGFVCEIEESQTPTGLLLQVHTPEATALIGPHGETLEQLQFLLNRVLQGESLDAPRVQVDVGHYRTMQADALAQKVRQLAETVRLTGEPVLLDPMNSYERRIVHDTFKGDPDILSSSPSDDSRIKRITLERRHGK